MRQPEALKRPWPDFLAGERRNVLGLLVLAFGLALAPWSHVMGAIPTLITGCYLLGWRAVSQRFNALVFAKLMAAAGLAVLLYLPILPFRGHAERPRDDGFLARSTQSLEASANHRANLFAKGSESAVEGRCRDHGTADPCRNSRILARDPCIGPQGGAIFGLTVVLTAGHWLAMVALTYLVQPVLLPRALIFSQPPLILLLAGLPWCLPERFRISAGLAFLTYLGAGFALHDIRLNPYAHYETMVAEIAASPQADAPVLVIPGHFRAAHKLLCKPVGRCAGHPRPALRRAGFHPCPCDDHRAGPYPCGNFGAAVDTCRSACILAGDGQRYGQQPRSDGCAPISGIHA